MERHETSGLAQKNWAIVSLLRESSQEFISNYSKNMVISTPARQTDIGGVQKTTSPVHGIQVHGIQVLQCPNQVK